mgnify:CR=1 FL=1
MSDSLQTDSVIPAKPSAFKRAIRKFMNFSDFDTLYISHNRYNYALMTTHFSNFEYYSVTSNLPQPQKLSFSPNPHNKIGLYFGWRWIFLGWSVDVDDIESAWEEVRMAGLAPLEDAIQFLPFWENGVRFFNLLGPNGETVEFSQRL